MQFEVEPVPDRREQIDARVPGHGGNLHEIESLTRDAGLIPHWKVFSVSRNRGGNSGSQFWPEDIGAGIMRISEVHGASL
jgi:hypothetical protein